MMGIKYLRVEAYSQRKPLVVLLGIGSNLGSHEGMSPLNVMIQDISRNLGMATVIAAGNETGRGHHYMGSVPMGEESVDVEIRVGNAESQRGFVVELWAATADTYSVGFVSPSGESIGRIPIIGRNETSIGFLLEPTVINLLSWGIIEGHNMAMSEATIKAFLIRGAKRNPALSYPNREWGYGALDLYETFLRLREIR